MHGVERVGARGSGRPGSGAASGHHSQGTASSIRSVIAFASLRMKGMRRPGPGTLKA